MMNITVAHIIDIKVTHMSCSTHIRFQITNHAQALDLSHPRNTDELQCLNKIAFWCILSTKKIKLMLHQISLSLHKMTNDSSVSHTDQIQGAVKAEIAVQLIVSCIMSPEHGNSNVVVMLSAKVPWLIVVINTWRDFYTKLATRQHAFISTYCLALSNMSCFNSLL